MLKRSGLNKRGPFDIVFDGLIYLFMLLFFIIVAYPILYVLALSFSSREAVLNNEVYIIPVGFNFDNYKLVLKHEFLPKAFLNSVFYTVFGTLYSMILTILGAYALSRKNYFGRDFIMFLIAFTMMFGGGMIPSYMLIKNLGLLNTRLALIIPFAVSQYNLIVMRTYMQQIPSAIEESAKLDGANDFVILFRIFVPMPKPVIATITLFYAAGQWNDFFSGLIYLDDKNKFPLQLVIRDLLITQNDATLNQGLAAQQGMPSLTPGGFRAAIVVVTVLPLLVVYPFIQKYFVKGVMLGSIKG